MADHPGRDGLGRRVDDAADRPFRPDRLPLDAARIDGFEARAGERAAVLVEIPPRDAVGRRHHGGLRAQHRRHFRRDGGRRVGLDGDDHRILRAGLRRIVGRGRPADPLPAVDMQHDAVLADCRQGAVRAIMVTSIPARASSHPR